MAAISNDEEVPQFDPWFAGRLTGVDYEPLWVLAEKG